MFQKNLECSVCKGQLCNRRIKYLTSFPQAQGDNVLMLYHYITPYSFITWAFSPRLLTFSDNRISVCILYSFKPYTGKKDNSTRATIEKMHCNPLIFMLWCKKDMARWYLFTLFPESQSSKVPEQQHHSYSSHISYHSLCAQSLNWDYCRGTASLLSW